MTSTGSSVLPQESSSSPARCLQGRCTASMQSRLSSFALKMKKELPDCGRQLVMRCPQASTARNSAATTAMAAVALSLSIGMPHLDFLSSNLQGIPRLLDKNVGSNEHWLCNAAKDDHEQPVLK